MLRRRPPSRSEAGRPVRPPAPHPSGARPPAIPAELVPRHVAIVMDGNGRWANQRGLTRVEGHKRGEARVVEAAIGCLELGVKWLSLYAFSTENWRRSAEEVRFIMGFSRDVIRHRTDELDEMGVRMHWAGRRPRLWRSVIRELEVAEERTLPNDKLHLAMCINYGGRAEIGDAARRIAQLAAEGKINPDKVDERTVAKYLYQPDMPDVDLFIRPSGERRTSNFMLWPDFDRTHLWAAVTEYARRDRRFGAARDSDEVAAQLQTGDTA